MHMGYTTKLYVNEYRRRLADRLKRLLRL
jgi:hypothetical protein